MPPPVPHESNMSASPQQLPPCRHIRINLGDPAIVKHTLDEQAAMYLLEQGYSEDVRLSNLKLFLGVLCVALTLLAQFYPVPFPASTNFLGGCVVVYFAIQAVLQGLHMLVERECIVLTKRREQQQAEGGHRRANHKGSSKKGKKKSHTPSSSPSPSSPFPSSLPPYAVSLQASLARYDTTYRLTLSTRRSESVWASLKGSSAYQLSDVQQQGAAVAMGGDSSASSSAPTPAIVVTRALEITEFFDVQGVFLMDKFQQRIREMLEEYTQQAQVISNNSSRGEGKKEQ